LQAYEDSECLPWIGTMYYLISEDAVDADEDEISSAAGMPVHLVAFTRSDDVMSITRRIIDLPTPDQIVIASSSGSNSSREEPIVAQQKETLFTAQDRPRAKTKSRNIVENLWTNLLRSAGACRIGSRCAQAALNLAYGVERVQMASGKDKTRACTKQLLHKALQLYANAVLSDPNRKREYAENMCVDDIARMAQSIGIMEGQVSC